MTQRCEAVLGPSNRAEACQLGVVVRRRFWRNAATLEGLSALTQLPRLATDYDSSTQREAHCSQLAQLTGLRELDAPRVLQTDGEKKQCHPHFCIRPCMDA
jgi:monoamine oxidase